MTTTEREYNPINPFNLPVKQKREYFNKFRELQFLEDQVPNFYRGSEKLLELINEGQIGLGVIIRVNRFSWGKDPHYMITPKGLVDIVHGDEKVLTPEQALDEYDDLKWEISGQDIYISPS